MVDNEYPREGSILVNPLRRADYRPPPAPSPRWFHQRLPGYAVTPLVEMPALAASLDLERVFVKDEASRLGLPAFKMLGASWAIYRALSERLGIASTDWATIDDLKLLASPARPLTLAAATDGNHGRAVARMARLLGFGGRIWVPSNTVPARIAAIEGEGATVHVCSGGYDDAVAASAEAADAHTLVISDTSWPGYHTVPAWVIEGYETILQEIDNQLGQSPDAVVVPIGVGALAAAVARHYRQSAPGPALIGVEPIDAACMMESVRAGKPIQLAHEQKSIMAGLNCGTPSPLAWPTVSACFDMFVTVSDDEDIGAMRLFNRNGIFAGESGAASLAGLITVARADAAFRETLAHSKIVLLSTEGITDPEFYARHIDPASH
jgi:diaminopropionate ammonia-lyase